MSLLKELNLDENFLENVGSPLPSFETELFRITQGMLRTCWSYAKNIPEKIFLIIQQNPETKETESEVLFQIGGKLYEKATLNASRLKDVTFDISPERQNSLTEYMKKDFEELRDLINKHDYDTPDEIFTSVDIEEDDQKIDLNYYRETTMPDITTQMLKWKEKIEMSPSVEDILRKIDEDLGIFDD